jgi:topoisomerase-4 subunit A
LRQLARLEEFKIRAEQDELAAEQGELKLLLGSDIRLKTLIKKELKTVAVEHGDNRRSPLQERDEAIAFNEKDLLTAEPITVVLSDKGWIRAGKGHEIDPETLSYKSGDKFLSSSRGRSNQNVFLQDSTISSMSISVVLSPKSFFRNPVLEFFLIPVEACCPKIMRNFRISGWKTIINARTPTLIN